MFGAGKFFLKEVSYIYQSYIFWSKNTVKVILWNIIRI